MSAAEAVYAQREVLLQYHKEDIVEYEQISLSNGMPAIVAATHRFAPVSIQVWFSCGARMEQEHESGLTHFIEHLFFCGGKDFPDAESVDRELRLLGNQNNAATSMERMFCYVTASAAHIRRAMHVLSDMLVYGRVEPEIVEKERGAILQELRSMEDAPEAGAAWKYNRLLFGNQPLGRNIIGTSESISGFTPDQILSFRERFCGPPNAVAVVAGDVDSGEAREALEQYFGRIPARSRAGWQQFSEPVDRRPAYLLRRTDSAQAYLHIGGFGPSIASPDAPAARLLAHVLEQRLWRIVRIERGLAYDVSVSPTFYSDCGAVSADTGVDPNEETIALVLTLIFSEMQDIKEGNILEEEVADTKTMARAVFDLSLESVTAAAGFLGAHTLVFGSPKSRAAVYAEIENVTSADIVRLARSLWREDAVRTLLSADCFPDFAERYEALRSVLR